MRKFKDLEIWNLSREIAIQLYKATGKLPKEEIYGLTTQMRRASISIPSNIADGCSRSSNKDFARFLEIAIGSSFELETQLIIASELSYLKEEEVATLLERLNLLQQKINAFITSVKKF